MTSSNEPGQLTVSEKILDLFKWLAKVATPLGVSILAITSVYWFEFTKTYALPVSFTSPGVLAGLPSLAAAVAATLAVLTAACLLPAIFLSMPIDGNERTMFHARQLERSNKATKTSWRSLSLPEHWGLISIGFALCWPAIIFRLFYLFSANAGPMLLGLVVLMWALAYFLMRGSYFPTGSHWRSTFTFLAALFGAVSSQMFVVFGIYYAALKMAPDDQNGTLAKLIFACTVISLAIALAQLLMARKMVHGWSSQDAKISVLLAVFVMAIPLGYPPFGGVVAAYPLHISAPDGNGCVEFYATDSASKKTWSDIANLAHPDQSRPLWFATRLDDTYYAKLSRQSPTQLIPAVQVRKVGGCPVTAPPPAASATAPKATFSPQSGNSVKSDPALWISAASMLVAILSLFFTMRAWRQSNRPLLTARISTHDGGNMGISLNLLIENTGTRPALDIALHADEADVRAAMADPGSEHPIPTDANRVLFSNIVVPVLANGRGVSNAFGSLGTAGVWRPGATIPVEVSYRGMTGPHFKEHFQLLLSDDAGFAQTYWSKSDA